MRIAQVAPLIERVPPKKYGGTERVIHALTEELVRRGHDVTLFASGDSKTSARLVSVCPRNLREVRSRDMYGINEWTLMNIAEAYEHQKEFDIIHDHTGLISFPAAHLGTTPTIITNHGPFTPYNKNIFQRLCRPYVVTISHAQGKDAANLNHAGTVYNGLNMEHYPFSEQSAGYLVFVGRISMEKGVHHAIEVAQFLNLPLIIAAKVETYDQPYFETHIEPHLTDTIRWVGEVTETERNELMSKALAFLHPVTWREPFGLTLIEAMACGCPVIAFNKGSIPEIVQDGRTGFVVEDVEGMLDAVQRIGTIERAACRTYALKKFNAAQMADGYERIYQAVIKKQKR